MKFARIAVLGVALGAAVGAALLARGMLPSGDKKAMEAAKPKFDTTKVLVAVKDVGLGKKVMSGSMKWQEWPKSAVTSRYITQQENPKAFKDLSGSIARAPLLAGEPIVREKLVKLNSGGFMSAMLNSGMRAVSVKISPETGAGGFILPNDRVDILVTRRIRAGGREKHLSETVLQNIRVLAIDQELETKKDKEQVVVGKTATVELWPSQAEELALAEASGDISLALRSLQDSASNGASPGDPALLRGRRKGSITVLRYGMSSSVQTGR